MGGWVFVPAACRLDELRLPVHVDGDERRYLYSYGLYSYGLYSYGQSMLTATSGATRYLYPFATTVAAYIVMALYSYGPI